MDALVRHLAQMRSEYEEARSRVQAAKEAIAASKLGCDLAEAEENVRVLAEFVEGAEQSVRNVALLEYQVDGNTDPHAAVKIKLYTVLDYEAAEALRYCREHLPQALKLDKRSFETAAKALVLDFVQIDKEPRATIARDLSVFLTVTEGD